MTSLDVVPLSPAATRGSPTPVAQCGPRRQRRRRRSRQPGHGMFLELWDFQIFGCSLLFGSWNLSQNRLGNRWKWDFEGLILLQSGFGYCFVDEMSIVYQLQVSCNFFGCGICKIELLREVKIISKWCDYIKRSLWEEYNPALTHGFKISWCWKP